jgi:hypothetical protein
MILIAFSILSEISARTDKAVGICRSTSFYKENPQNKIFRGIILTGKFG